MNTRKYNIPRILLAGANSGCGKTSVTCGVLKALTDRGIKIQSYKCGPDYIDPMLHSHITGKQCRNLDPFFSTQKDLRRLVIKDSQTEEFSVTEGVMGYYDGIGVTCDKSTYTVSMATDTPTILILNVKGMSHTMIPLIKGMMDYQPNPIKGVILNRCSKGLYQLMKPEIESTLGIKVVGYFPYKEGVSIGSRHLGLMTAAEIDNLNEVIELLGENAKEGIDLDALLEIGHNAEEISLEAEEINQVIKQKNCDKAQVEKLVRNEIPEFSEPGNIKARIAVAWDKAFCFYYKENLEILEKMGAELVYFSPVKDKELPDNVGGIYLGGGYPETYRKELSQNLSMKESIKKAKKEGKPIFAECGGFMYTCDNLVETDGSSQPMMGLIKTDVQMTSRLSMQFGYVTLEAQRDTAFWSKGTKIRAHEFHYSKAAKRGEQCRISKYSGKCWDGIYVEERVLSGYPHFYFDNCREMARRFVDMAAGFLNS